MASEIPPEKKALLDAAVRELSRVPGMLAIALGGSHARGTHTPESDLDIGLYYREASPFLIEDIRRVANMLSASGAPTVTGFYEWGPFVNGGAWIDNKICKIDFLYRNLDQLVRTIADAERGKTEHNFDQQPPFGFRTVTTLGEVACCEPLFDPNGTLEALKSRVATYPPALKTHIVQTSLWAAEFSFFIAEGFVRDNDVPNTAGCMTRIYHYLVQALFALNETYFINDKRAALVIERFSLLPTEFQPRTSVILGRAGTTRDELHRSIAALHAIWAEVAALTRGGYRSKFAIP